jgi:hypothetical protein
MTLDRRAWLVAMLMAGKLASAAESDDDAPRDHLPATAQPPAVQPEETHSTQSESGANADALAGPKVAEDSLGVSLVSHDFRGDFQRLSEPAEEAALRLLTLSDAEKAATQKILTERAAILDGVVGDNLSLLLRLQGFKEEGPTPDRMTALREITEKLAPLRARGRLRDELAAVLTSENAVEFRRIVDGYWDALIDSTMAKDRRGGGGKSGKAKAEKNATGGGGGDDEGMMDEQGATARAERRSESQSPADRSLRRQIVVRETLQATGAELKRAFDRRIADGTAKLEDALTAIDTTPEQSDAIRNKVLIFYQETLGKPTPQQRTTFFRSLMKDLTPTQRKALVKSLYGGGAGGDMDSNTSK